MPMITINKALAVDDDDERIVAYLESIRISSEESFVVNHL